jgi:hypothetical protein
MTSTKLEFDTSKVDPRYRSRIDQLILALETTNTGRAVLRGGEDLVNRLGPADPALRTYRIEVITPELMNDPIQTSQYKGIFETVDGKYVLVGQQIFISNFDANIDRDSTVSGWLTKKNVFYKNTPEMIFLDEVVHATGLSNKSYENSYDYRRSSWDRHFRDLEVPNTTTSNDLQINVTNQLVKELYSVLGKEYPPRANHLGTNRSAVTKDGTVLSDPPTGDALGNERLFPLQSDDSRVTPNPVDDLIFPPTAPTVPTTPDTPPPVTKSEAPIVTPEGVQLGRDRVTGNLIVLRSEYEDKGSESIFARTLSIHLRG